jgi:hypothetical protein
MNRRDFLENSTIGSLALASLLTNKTHAVNAPAVEQLHTPPRAKRVIQLFMAGAASHIDMFDHKPVLEKIHGQKSDFG